ncbi:hypothetical protein J2T12_005062 [Paenibacillus anaericanus]|nr:hypothetical protein [Paenibacillus anaericanus]
MSINGREWNGLPLTEKMKRIEDAAKANKERKWRRE